MHALSACLLQSFSPIEIIYTRKLQSSARKYLIVISNRCYEISYTKKLKKKRVILISDRFVQEILLLLTRSLSRSFQPSPPYRFHKYNAYRERVSSLFYLLKPSITKVSPLFLEFRPGLSHFYADEEIKVFTSIESIPVIDDHEVISTLIRVIDLRTDEKISISSSYSVDFHPAID